jgi:hypothetical protein
LSQQQQQQQQGQQHYHSLHAAAAADLAPHQSLDTLDPHYGKTLGACKTLVQNPAAHQTLNHHHLQALELLGDPHAAAAADLA